MYKEADSRLANAFRTPASQAAAGVEHDAEDAALAVRFVHQLEAMAPLNIDGLRALVERRQQMVLREAEISLDAADYLQVSLCWAQLGCLVESQALRVCRERYCFCLVAALKLWRRHPVKKRQGHASA